MTKLKELLAEHRESLQLLYGILLIILIPTLIAYNTIFIIGNYNDNINSDLQLKMRLVGRTIYADLQDDLGDEASIQAKIERVSAKNSELENISVLVPEDEGYKIIASSNKEEIGKSLTFYFYQSAWIQSDNNGLITDSLQLATTDDGQEMALNRKANGRFWMMAMPMQDTEGNKKALLSIRSSSKVVDDLTEESRNESLIVLLITVIIIIFFLSITVRLWDYVVLYKKIKEVDQMKDEFISIASHELRTPLTSIKGYTSLIMEGDYGKVENAGMYQGLERIMTSTQRLEALVEDLLNVSRIEQGRLSVENKDIEIEPIIEEIVSQLSVTAEQKNLKLVYEKASEKLPHLSADPERLKQILINLIGNAIKYTETGSVTVNNEIKDNELRIKITDTGIGISPEGQKNLFQKFYRVKTDKTESVQGTGLGLWITKQLIELMGGKIFLESIEGKGTQVTIVLNITEKKI